MSLTRRYRAFTLSRQQAGADQFAEPSYSVVGTYYGLIQPRSGGESVQFNQVGEQYSHVLYCSVSTPIETGDRVQQDGVTWRAVWTVQTKGISSVGHHKEISLQYV